MISCKGCKYYYVRFGSVSNAFCTWYNYHDHVEFNINPYDGRLVRTHIPVPGKPGVFSPWLHEMRCVGGPCGPEAKLREPTLRERLVSWFKKF